MNTLIAAFEKIEKLALEAETLCANQLLTPPKVKEVIIAQIRSIAQEQINGWVKTISELSDYTEEMEIQDAIDAKHYNQAEQLAKDAGYKIVEEDLENINAKEALFLDPRD